MPFSANSVKQPTTTTHTIWRKLKDGTRKAYAGALSTYLRYSRINRFMAPREALKGRILYYNDEEDHGEVDPAVAARGLGQVGNVPITESLWSRCVPEDLRGRYQKWRQETHGVDVSDGVGVREMLDALVQDGALRKHENVPEDSGKTHVRPKSSEKCAFMLNCVKQNACDDCKPRGFQLPQIERLWDYVLLGGRQRLYMAKLDMSNWFWSLCLPRPWVGEFSVCVGDAQYVWQSLPFGWIYSPLPCQKLVYSVVRTSLWWLPVLFFVYLDDILVLGTRRFVRKVVRRVRQRLQRVGFVISQKSVTEPARDLHFVGKVFGIKRGTLENRPGMLRGLVRLWLLLVSGLLNRKGMERLLGRLEWALWPSAGLSPFLAGAYSWKHAWGIRGPRALLRPLLTAICFAFVPQKYPVKAKVQAEPPTC